MEIKYFIEGKIKETFYHEWLISNKNGSYGLGTGNLIPNRKYHGLFILNDLNQKFHMVSFIEERVKILSESMYLDSYQYLDVIYPNGYRHIIKSWLLPFPTFLYSTYPFDESVLILKTIQMHNQYDIVRVSYKNIGSISFKLYLRPKFTFRNHHHLNTPGKISENDLVVNLNNEKDAFIFHKDSGYGLKTKIDRGVIRIDPLIYKNIYYPNEEIRGYPSVEDLYSPIVVKVEMEPESEVNLFFISNRDEEDKINKKNIDDEIFLLKLINEFNGYYIEELLPEDYPIKIRKNKSNKLKIDFPKIDLDKLKDDDSFLYEFKDLEKILNSMLNKFIMHNDIVAGFPWFGNWGRDTMIVLEVLNKDNKNKNLYYKILEKYGKNIKNGLIPNVIDEGGLGSNYNSIDSSLHYCNRIFDYLNNFKEESSNKIDKLVNYYFEVIYNYIFNKDLPFEFDINDCFLKIHEESKLALTWMDAKYLDIVITPRYEKPIEIQYLFYNAICNLLKIIDKLEIDIPKKYKKNLSLNYIMEIKEKLLNNLLLYFDGEIFGDTIYKNILIKEIRPNYLIGLSQENVKFDDNILEKAIEQADKYLVTPYGLRTLNIDNPSFRKRYIGDQKMRDMAYHQGTVWAWLILPFSKVLYKKLKKKNLVKDELLKRFINPINGILKGHYGTIAEVWDGVNPHFPKGAPAQAWSVAAFYYIAKEFF
jgi:glycogen debranching enzyme